MAEITLEYLERFKLLREHRRISPLYIRDKMYALSPAPCFLAEMAEPVSTLTVLRAIDYWYPGRWIASDANRPHRRPPASATYIPAFYARAK